MNTLGVASFGEILAAAWVRFKERIWVIIPSILVWNIIFLVPEYIKITGYGYFTQLASFTVQLLLGILLFLLSQNYYLFIVLDEVGSVSSIFSSVVKRFYSFVWLSARVTVRTFAWIVFLGMLAPLLGYTTLLPRDTLLLLSELLMLVGSICVIFLGPRYMLAYILWARDDLMPTDAVNKSYAVTEGYWSKMIGNSLLFNLVIVIMYLPIPLVFFLVYSPYLLLHLPIAFFDFGSFVWLIIMLSISAAKFYAPFSFAFMLRLTETLEAHPRGTLSPASVPTVTTVAEPVSKPAVAPKKTSTPKPASKKGSAKKATATKVRTVKKKTAPKKKSS